jgi:hypothetical protein
LLAALVVVAAAPWNVALWWQLWRLRFALEIDCDARVLRGATPDTPYAEALLEVQQRRTRMPIAAVALIEPVSQLERRIRIMMSRQNPSRRAVLGVCAPAAAAFVLAACAVNAPDAAAPMKPPPPFAPDGMGLVADTFRIVMERHGTELRNNERRVAEVALFFDESGSLVRSTIETMDDEPPMPTPASQGGPSGYLAFCLEKLEGKPGCAIDPTTNLTMHAVRIELYGSIDNVVDGGYSEDVDRRLAERYFADIFSAPPTENSSYWVLLDSAGTPLAAGREMLRTLKELGPPATQMQEALEQRYPQAEIQGASLTLIRDRQSRTVTDRGGRNVMLYSAWLSADSPLPAAAP